MWRKIKDIYYEVKYAFQRMFRGYGDDEIIDFDYKFIERTARMLADIERSCDCFPAHKVSSLSQWKWKLRLMKYYLIRMDEDFYTDETGEYTDEYEEVMKQVEVNKKEFFHLFSEFFFDLYT